MGDFAHFEPLDLQKEDFEYMKEFFIKCGMQPHQAIGSDSDGNPVLMFGYIPLGGGEFDTWTMFSKYWSPRYYRSAINWFDNYCGIFDFNAATHVVRESRKWMVPIIEKFGFCFSETLNNYINGETCYKYTRLKGERHGN
jgi:hypothetical protein